MWGAEQSQANRQSRNCRRSRFIATGGGVPASAAAHDADVYASVRLHRLGLAVVAAVSSAVRSEPLLQQQLPAERWLTGNAQQREAAPHCAIVNSYCHLCSTHCALPAVIASPDTAVGVASPPVSGVAVSLQVVCSNQDIWDTVCGLCSGHAVILLPQVNRKIRAATLASPAWILLSGRDIDGFIVCWNDPSNILGLTVSYSGWNPSIHFRLRAGRYAHGWDRQMMAINAVDSFVSEHPGALVDMSAQYPKTHPKARSGTVKAVSGSISSPAIFPAADHRLAAAELALREMRQWACPGDSSSDDEGSGSISSPAVFPAAAHRFAAAERAHRASSARRVMDLGAYSGDSSSDDEGSGADE